MSVTHNINTLEFVYYIEFVSYIYLCAHPRNRNRCLVFPIAHAHNNLAWDAEFIMKWLTYLCVHILLKGRVWRGIPIRIAYIAPLIMFCVRTVGCKAPGFRDLQPLFLI